MEDLEDKIEKIQDINIQQGNTLIALRVHMENIEKDLNILNHIVKGNGTVENSLVVRLSTIETSIISIDKKLESISDQTSKSFAETTKGKWLLAAAIAGGVLTVAASAVKLLVG